jgi:hypothetical protein
MQQHLRNPWNGNKPIHVARDATEVEPNIGKQILELFDMHSCELAMVEQVQLEKELLELSLQGEFNVGRDDDGGEVYILARDDAAQAFSGSRSPSLSDSEVIPSPPSTPDLQTKEALATATRLPRRRFLTMPTSFESIQE